MSYENNTQCRKWTLVINNPQEHGFTREKIIELLHLFHPDYFCLADEIASTGTYHTHIFLFSHSAMRFGTLKRRFPTAHIEMAGGNCFQNREYILKGGKWDDARGQRNPNGSLYQGYFESIRENVREKEKSIFKSLTFLLQNSH